MDKEYIEREAVLRHKRKMSSADFGGEFWDEAVLCEEILKIPKADVAEIKRGQWETDKEDIEWGNALKRKYCSNCKKRPHFDKEERKFILTNYCPNCGAKMNDEKPLTWIPRDNWELGCEYDCPYCGTSIDVPHGGVMPHKCWKCEKEIGVN